jgi:hypothetical protein
MKNANWFAEKELGTAFHSVTMKERRGIRISWYHSRLQWEIIGLPNSIGKPTS